MSCPAYELIFEIYDFFFKFLGLSLHTIKYFYFLISIFQIFEDELAKQLFISSLKKLLFFYFSTDRKNRKTETTSASSTFYRRNNTKIETILDHISQKLSASFVSRI